MKEGGARLNGAVGAPQSGAVAWDRRSHAYISAHRRWARIIRARGASSPHVRRGAERSELPVGSEAERAKNNVTSQKYVGWIERNEMGVEVGGWKLPEACQCPQGIGGRRQRCGTSRDRK